jgi:DNA-binding transcriptional ArsR family regulator
VTGPMIGPVTGPETGAEAGAETGPKAGAEAGPEAGPETGAETGSETGSKAGPAAVPELDPVIHAQARLRVVVALSTVPEGDRITFPRLKDQVQMTAGNLSVHLRKLEDAGYVAITKTHRGRTPTTYVELTRRGRLAFEDYTAAIRALLEPPADASPSDTSCREPTEGAAS